MIFRKILFRTFLFAIVMITGFVPVIAGATLQNNSGPPPPILLYHRFGPTPVDSMTVTPATFASHLDYLKSKGYVVIPLRQIVESRLRNGIVLPDKSAAVVVDDGHISVFREMLPIVKKYKIPVTLFIYPSAISNASYAMTWDQLRELRKTGFFDIQSHTYWHPNFKNERKRLSAPEYEKFVAMQLVKPRTRLEKEFGTRVDLLAWPFGIYDEYLMAKAREAGYVAAFTIEGDREHQFDNPMKIPRYLLSEADKGKRFERILNGHAEQRLAGRNAGH